MKGVLMTKMVQELNLTNLTPEIDLSEMRIMTAEINRPALQLTGYLEHFKTTSSLVDSASQTTVSATSPVPTRFMQKTRKNG